ncbi:dnaJ homolog subfamily C member 28 [Anoplophora glabripennis]|nr:dnaJ homolog subfamily C member 28 [Anoplophora glabripennis]XP_018561109.1 dnaJ homolog subfamily C member 28 [Anoplophora glabripennis]
MALYLFVRRSAPVKNIAHFSLFKNKKLDYKKCYQLLEIDENSDQEQIRAAYLKLVKRYHPDSGTEEANTDKFHEVDKAFRLLIRKKSKERWDIEEAVIIEEPDIKHTAPQHRQYLSYDGIGSGNPFQRQKQYAKVRAMKAAENVYEHRVSKAQADDSSLLDKSRIYETWEKVPLKHKIKTKHGFDRLVEDLIQESMSKGEFNNLKGSGKPLPSYQNRNPYVDFVTHKINEVLIDNGFQPEWITLQKEIREEANRLRGDLLTERKYFGPYPLSVEENIEWSDKVYGYKDVVDKLNKKIEKYNLVVPVLNKQMLQISLENEAQRVMINGESIEDMRFDTPLKRERKREIENSDNEGANLFGFIEYFFKGK